MKSAVSISCILLLVFGVTPSAAWGQTSAGQVVITLQDSSGGALVGAQVELRDENTGATQSQATGADGFARFVSVRPSTYTIDISSSGFKRVTRQGVVVNVAQSVSLTITLELGSVSESVEVVGGAPLLQTERGELGQVIGTKQVVELTTRPSAHRFRRASLQRRERSTRLRAEAKRLRGRHPSPEKESAPPVNQCPACPSW
jgi:hypothetical protein